METYKRKLALSALVSAFILGVTGDVLVRAQPWGVNVLLGALLVVGILVVLMRRARRADVASLALAAVPALLVASAFVWRDSHFLSALDVLMLMGFSALFALAPRGVRAWNASVTDVGVAVAATGVQAAVGVGLLPLADVQWRQVPVGETSRSAGKVLRGVLIALPLLLVFGALLAAADALFSKLLEELFRFDLATAVSHVVVTMIFTAIAAGVLRSLLFAGAAPAFPRPELLRLGATEANIALGLVNALFLTFVVVQFGYFFGGAAPNLRYSEYARRGFFELVAVVALVVPLLLVAEWLLDQRDAAGVRTFRALAALQVLLVLTIAASALHRMRLYQTTYGWTELRLYATAFIVWLGVVLLWLALTVLTGHRSRFFLGTFLSGVIALAILHVVNPDDVIVRANVANARAGRRPLDTSYATSLSADATPALLANLDAIDPAQRPCVAKHLLRVGAPIDDWRTWNASRARASAQVEPRKAELTEVAKGCGR